MRRSLLLVVCALYLVPCTFSQAPASWTSAEMYQALRKLNVLGSVLYVAAHPDDENTRLIAYLSKDKLYRTGYLSLTRGDGGQNLIGDEQGIELGLIRTQELLSARRIDGGEQFFSRAYDFGFSKNPEETFTKWDKEKILSDVVWVIRKFQPDVIITRFPTTGEGGHGHHTASAILANEAFTAAADPNRFPEQLLYVSVWQAKRILWNTFNFGNTNTQSNDQFKIDVGGYNPLLGKSYGEISAASRSQHKSQGFGVPASRGEAIEYFKATGGTTPTEDLMDGVGMTWGRVADGAPIEKMVNDLSASFDFLHPERSVKGLNELYKALMNMRQGYWRDVKLWETQQLIVQCSGLFMDVTAAEQFAVQTDSLRFNFSFNNRLGADISLEKVIVNGFDTILAKPLTKNKNLVFSKTLYVNPDLPVTQPYWLENKMEEGYFTVKDQQKIGRPDVEPSIQAAIQIKVFGEYHNFRIPVKYKFTDPVRGELYEPLVVIPPVLVSPDEKIKISKNSNNFEGSINLAGKKKGFKTIFGATGTTGTGERKIDISSGPYIFENKNKTITVPYTVKADSDNGYNFSVDRDNNKKELYSQGMKEVKYDHIPYINYFTDATVINKKVDLEIYNKKIGYIVGAGDKVPEALEQMGYEVNILTEKELSRNNLDKFDAIITGVRAYNTNEWINKYYDKLMKYVNDGGNLIVQYNTSNNIGPVRARIDPYNLTITRTRVTDENAKVTILKPGHPVFNFPNKITDEDFKGWIQERSIYHGSDTSGKYEKLIGMNDPGERSDDGSLLVAKYGKGWFTYTGIVFFRELPAGVPGAYRLLANIIALNKKKGF